MNKVSRSSTAEPAFLVRGLPLLIAVALSLAVIASFVLSQRVSAQAGCAPLDPAIHGWPKGSTAYYDVSSLTEPAKSQALSAFAKWNTANASNGSGGSFQQAASPIRQLSPSKSDQRVAHQRAPTPAPAPRPGLSPVQRP